MESTVKLHSLHYSDMRTYMVALMFITGNIILPQLFHLLPQGGVTWLPIYFFTLIGAYKYGWKAGLLTAIASPLVNSILFGMPPAGALPAIMLKSVILAMLAGWVAYRTGKASLAMLLAVVIGYQVIGTLGEWGMKADFYAAVQDFRIGLPGMALQVTGGWFVLNHLIRN